MHWLGAFLGCFMKFEVVNYAPYNKLSLIDVASNVLKLKTCWRWKLKVSVVVTKKQNSKRDNNQFSRRLCTAYVTTAVYIQKKYVLNDPVLDLCYANHLWCMKTFYVWNHTFKLCLQEAVVSTHLKYKSMSLIQDGHYQKRRED